jgi:hypothetical protein
MEFIEKPHTDKYNGITNDSNYVASCTPTSPVRHLRPCLTSSEAKDGRQLQDVLLFYLSFI